MEPPVIFVVGNRLQRLSLLSTQLARFARRPVRSVEGQAVRPGPPVGQVRVESRGSMAHDANRRSRQGGGLSLRNTATVQHRYHAPNSPGSGSSFTISGIGSPRTIRQPTSAGLQVGEVAPVGCVPQPATGDSLVEAELRWRARVLGALVPFSAATTSTVSLTIAGTVASIPSPFTDGSCQNVMAEISEGIPVDPQPPLFSTDQNRCGRQLPGWFKCIP
jgi:hypothetical protein